MKGVRSFEALPCDMFHMNPNNVWIYIFVWEIVRGEIVTPIELPGAHI